MVMIVQLNIKGYTCKRTKIDVVIKTVKELYAIQGACKQEINVLSKQQSNCRLYKVHVSKKSMFY